MLKGFTVRQPRRPFCPCHEWAIDLRGPTSSGHHPECNESHLRFPTENWQRGDTQKGRNVRKLLMAGYNGGQTSTLAPMIDATIGPDDYDTNREFHVHIPFVTRSGVEVTLYGGHIHATDGVTWDILCEYEDGVREYEYDEDRFPCGLECLSTVELIRAIRVL